MALGKQSKILSKAQTDAVTSYLGTRRHGLRDQTIFLLSIKAGLRAKEISSPEVVDGSEIGWHHR